MIEIDHRIILFRCPHAFARISTKKIAQSKHATLADIIQRYRAQERIDLIAQFLPQIMGKTAAFIHVTAPGRTAFAACCPDRLVNSHDDIGNPCLFALTGQQIPASRSAHTGNQTITAQLAE